MGARNAMNVRLGVGASRGAGGLGDPLRARPQVFRNGRLRCGVCEAPDFDGLIRRLMSPRQVQRANAVSRCANSRIGSRTMRKARLCRLATISRPCHQAHVLDLRRVCQESASLGSAAIRPKHLHPRERVRCIRLNSRRRRLDDGATAWSNDEGTLQELAQPD